MSMARRRVVSLKTSGFKKFPSWLYRGFRIVGFGALAFAVFWPFFAVTLRSNYGFDLTDEALHILGAREGKDANWRFPWGWHSAPLFSLVEGDISGLRTAGASLLALAGVALGASAARVIEPSNRADHETGHNTFWLMVILGAISTFLFYTGMLRSPSYNWVNLMGVLLAATGVMLALARPEELRRPIGSYALGSAMLVGFGFFVSVVAKPSTPLLFVALSIFSMLFVASWGSVLWYLFHASLASVGFGSLAVAAGVWPYDFAVALFRPNSLGLVNDPAALAVVDVVRLPLTLLEDLSRPSSLHAVPFWLGLGLLILSYTFPGRKRILMLTGAVIGAFAVVNYVLVGGGADFSLEPLIRRGQSEVVTGLLLLFAISLALHLSCKSASLLSIRDYRSRISAAVILLLGIPFIFGFGSLNGVYRQSLLGGIGFVLAVLLLLMAFRGRKLLLARVSLGVALTAVIAIVAVDSYRAPYHIAPFEDQVWPVSITGDPKARIYVDGDTADYVSRLREIFREGGFQADDSIVISGWPWSAAEPLILDSPTPSSLMLTVGGYEGSGRVGVQNIRNEKNLDFRSAWLVVPNLDSLGTDDRRDILEMLEEVSTHSTLTFPEDYSLLGSVGGNRVYRPK